MSYSPEVYSRVQKLYEERRSRALTDLEGRIGQAKEQVPESAPVEEVLGATRGAGDRSHQEKRRRKSLGNGAPGKRRAGGAAEGSFAQRRIFRRSFCDPRFLCPRCGDTGYREGRRCTCLKEALYEAQAELSGLGRLLKSQNFENFQTHYYSDREEAGGLRDFCQDMPGRASRKAKTFF